MNNQGEHFHPYFLVGAKYFLEIELLNKNSSKSPFEDKYFLGEKIKGKVILTCKEDTKVFGVFVKFTGNEVDYSYCPPQNHWLIDGTHSVFGHKLRACSMTDPVTREKSEGCQKNFLSQQEQDGFHLSAGRNEWPFTFRIPKFLPPSVWCCEQKAKIEYLVTAYLDSPWDKTLSCAKSINVGISKEVWLSMNSEVISRPPVKQSKMYLLRGSSNSSRKQTLNIEASSTSSFVYFGDSVAVNVSIDNNSGRNVNGLHLKLKQVIKTGNRETKKRTIVERSYCEKLVFPIRQKCWNGLIELLLPPENLKMATTLGLLPTVSNSKLVNVNYFLSLTARVSAGGDVKVRIPITIGSFRHSCGKGISRKKTKGKKLSKNIEDLNLSTEYRLSLEQRNQKKTSNEIAEEYESEKIKYSPPEYNKKLHKTTRRNTMNGIQQGKTQSEECKLSILDWPEETSTFIPEHIGVNTRLLYHFN